MLYLAWDREINISLFFCDVFVWKWGLRPRTRSRCYHGNKSASLNTRCTWFVLSRPLANILLVWPSQLVNKVYVMFFFSFCLLNFLSCSFNFSMNVRKSSPQICTSVWLWAACCHTLEMPVLARVTSKSHHRIQLQTDGVCGEGLSSLSSVPAKHHRSDHRTQSSATANTCRFAHKQSFWDMTWLFLIDWFWLNGMFFLGELNLQYP